MFYLTYMLALQLEKRRQLEADNGGARLCVRDLGEAGRVVLRTDFVAASQLSFPASEVKKIGALTVGRSDQARRHDVPAAGLAQTPLGGQSPDVYVKLAQLQAFSDREGRVNTVQVRADSGDDIAAARCSKWCCRARQQPPR